MARSSLPASENLHRSSHESLLVTYALLTAQARQCHVHDWRRVPLASKCLRFWSVKAHQQVERTFRGRKPVSYLVRTRTCVLEIQVKRSIGVVPQRHPTADVKAVEGV